MNDVSIYHNMKISSQPIMSGQVILGDIIRKDLNK
ncbi:hypothetical protein COPEUT_02086 [Coprococcus eutactus ATCC 27759]|nr:hypothetical protein COPEUT_02086 [Coprococcus eutactus ATCC 27759]